MIAFWIAIGLPLLYLPLLFSGIENQTELLLFLGLLGFHIVALIRGQDYREKPE